MLETTWIDTHTHLFASEFDSDRSEVIARAVEAGVKVLLLPNIDCESIGSLEALLDQYPDYCLGAMGLHPTSVEADWRVQMRQIEQALGRRKYAAIGEIGLDFYWDLSHADEQREAFCYQLALCKEMGLPALLLPRCWRFFAVVSLKACGASCMLSPGVSRRLWPLWSWREFTSDSGGSAHSSGEYRQRLTRP